MIKEPKVGQYFKGVVDDHYVTGRISTEKYGKELAVVFDNSCINSYVIAEDYYGFDGCVYIQDVEDFQIITKTSHEKLLKHPLYSGFKDYYVGIRRQSNPKGDVFTFGCGAVEVDRWGIEQLLALLKKVDIEEIYSVFNIITQMEDAGEILDSSDIPEIKKLLDDI